MKRSFVIAALVAVALPSATWSAAPDMSHAARAEAYAREFLASIQADPQMIAALAASTEKHRRLDYEQSQGLDKQWRNERVYDRGGHGPLVDEVMGGPFSAWLKGRRDASVGGAVTDILVMDGLGWNAGQTDGTSDFYQGDEDRWQRTFAGGSALVSSVEEGDGRKLVQVSLPIAEGDRNTGAVTIGLDLGKLP